MRDGLAREQPRREHAGLGPRLDLFAQQVQGARVFVGPAVGEGDGRRDPVEAQGDRRTAGIVASVADDDGDAQAEQVQGEARVLQRCFQLAQAAALAEDEIADATQLALREARRVDVGEQVGLAVWSWC